MLRSLQFKKQKTWTKIPMKELIGSLMTYEINLAKKLQPRKKKMLKKKNQVRKMTI